MPAYPALLAAAAVLSEDSRTGVALSAITRPLLLATLTAIVLTLLLKSFLRSWLGAGLVSSAVILILRSGDAPHALAAAVLAVLVVVTLQLVRRRFRIKSEGIGPALNFTAFVLLAVTGTPPLAATLWHDAIPYNGPAGGTAPDIFVILLDGYPRADELERNAGISDEAFLAELDARGLQVSARSTSNYMYTAPSLVSFFGLGDDEEILSNSQRTPFTIGHLINNSPGMALLEANGYAVAATIARWEAESIRSADKFCDGGVLNEFELHLIRDSLIGRIVDSWWPDWEADRDRAVITTEFECAEAFAQAERHPSLYWVHVGGPHLPIVFSADGGAAGPDVYLEPLEVTAALREKVFRAYDAELSYLQSRTLEVLDTIDAESGADTVVLVMSDHGSWLRIGANYDEASDFRERFGTLFAARTPGHPNLFGDQVSVNQVLPIIANTYLGTDIPIPPTRFHFSRPETSLDAVEIPDPFVGFTSP